jgi:hypothetical protein
MCFTLSSDIFAVRTIIVVACSESGWFVDERKFLSIINLQLPLPGYRWFVVPSRRRPQPRREDRKVHGCNGQLQVLAILSKYGCTVSYIIMRALLPYLCGYG